MTHVCFTGLVVFQQPGSAGADYYQYDSGNAVNWQIRGKPIVLLKCAYPQFFQLPPDLPPPMMHVIPTVYNDGIEVAVNVAVDSLLRFSSLLFSFRIQGKMLFASQSWRNCF